MHPAPLPANEKDRLAILGECRLLDTPAEPDFDDLVELAAHICDTPIALVSLVDAKRQWFKAKVGLCLTETSRDSAFCAHAILSEGPLIIQDATQDVRTRDNPLVTGEPHVRFYAGIPLKVEKSVLGTLCVMDHTPRSLTPAQLGSLQRIARRVASHIALRRETGIHRRHAEAVINACPRLNRAAAAVFLAGLAATAVTTALTLPASHSLATYFPTSLAVGGGGSLLSLLLASMVWSTGRSRSRAFALAEVMTADLQDAKSRAEEVSSQLRTQSIALQNQRERLELALSTGGLGTWEWNIDTGACTFDDRWAAIIGEETQRSDIRDWLRRIHPDDLTPSTAALHDHFDRRDKIFESLQRLRRKDGSWRWTHVRGLVVARDDKGTPLRMVGITEDVTRQKEIEEAATAAHNLIRRTGELAHVGGWEGDLATGKVTWSDEVYRIHEMEIGAPVTRELVISLYHPDARATIESAVKKAVETGEPWDLELPRFTATGRAIWVRSQGECVYGENGVPIKLCGALQDITDRKLAEEQLRRSATHDKLTGLPNRTLLLDRLQHCIDRASRAPGHLFALLFLDFDRFKLVNDTLGHGAGDELLQQIAARLRNALRPGDTVAVSSDNFSTVSRLGGDEFVIVLDEIRAAADALAVADRLLNILAEPYLLGEIETVSTASIGIVTSSSHYNTAEQMLRDADIAMYEAKAIGRGRAVLFDRGMHDRLQARVATESDLRSALQRGQFALAYQPIVAIDTGATHSMEALIRWNHPTRGLVSPSEFIAIAEETGLIIPLGEWVLRTACKQFLTWRHAFGKLAPSTISVNLSRQQLARHDLLDMIRTTLAETGMQPQWLHLEITESTVMRDPAAAKRTLHALRDIGVKIDLDDFGTGHSSLASLHQYPIDVLKMDRAFIANLQRGRQFSALIQAIIQLAGNMEMQVVAEGVETPEQLVILQSMECKFGQGYLFSKPLAPDEVGGYLSRAAAWARDNFAPLLSTQHA
ncbi:MAG: sensor domain-containing phosphodiesterase [Phycisphaerae bacterium]